eukprot:scaffold31683_cov22-Prasinocladus_malaysianus.AAC.1
MSEPLTTATANSASYVTKTAHDTAGHIYWLGYVMRDRATWRIAWGINWEWATIRLAENYIKPAELADINGRISITFAGRWKPNAISHQMMT